MLRIPNNVMQFAGSDVSLFDKFSDYWNHAEAMRGREGMTYDTTISFDEKEKNMNSALIEAIVKTSGLNFDLDSMPKDVLVTNPNLNWATFAITGMLVDMVLPRAIIDSTRVYAEVRNIAWGDTAVFDVESNDLFVVSKSGRAQRQSEMHKQYKGQVTVNPEMRELTVGVALMRVLGGQESLADFVRKVVTSFGVQLSYDVYSAFSTAMDGLPTSPASAALQVTGYTQSDLVDLCQKVSAWNGGNQAVIMGTQAALASVLPQNANYRYDLQSEYVKIGYTRTAFGYDMMAMPQVADYKTPFSLKLDDDKIYIISPSSQKPVKLVLEGSTLANVQDFFSRANLTSTSTMMKAWGTGIATNAIAGQINLS